VFLAPLMTTLESKLLWHPFLKTSFISNFIRSYKYFWSLADVKQRNLVLASHQRNLVLGSYILFCQIKLKTVKMIDLLV